MKKIFRRLQKLSDPVFYLKLPSLLLFRFNRFVHDKFLFYFFSKEFIFTSIWRTNYWGSGESLSGPGSTLEHTKNIRLEIPKLLNELSASSIFDAPCGDMHWMSHVLSSMQVQYIGGDIVGQIIDQNIEKYSDEHISFTKFDITRDIFPRADVWLCRAVLYHLSNRDILKSLEGFCSSEIRYLLTTNCVTSMEHQNKDIASGSWRSLNLLLPPFNFPPNVLWQTEDYIPPHPPATLVLWSREQISAILPDIKKAILSE